MTADSMDMTELERIEYNRRMDIVGAVLSLSVRQFVRKKELGEEMALKKKLVASKWWWIVGLAALAIFYFLSDGSGIIAGLISGKLALPGIVAVFTYVYWVFAQDSLNQLHQKYETCSDSLHELAAKWSEAVGSKTFWGLAELITEYGIDENAEDFQKWWSEQRYLILQRVCGWDKAEMLMEKQEIRHAKFLDGLKSFVDSHADNGS
jgi:hypothetical protein